MRKSENKIKSRGIDLVFDISVYVILTGVLFIILYPLYLILIASISEPNAVYAGEVRFLPIGFTLLGYQKIFQEGKIWIGYRNTIIYTVLGTTLNVLLTMMAAYPLSRKSFKPRTQIMVFFLVTMYIGGGLIPTYLLLSELKLVNNPLVMIVTGAVTVWNLIITRTYYQSTIPEELYEAAAMDGGSHFHFFLKVALPLSKAIVAVNVLYYGVGHWNEFFTALIYLRNPNYYPLQLVIRSILIQNTVNPDELKDLSILSEDYQKVVELMKFSTIIVSSFPVLMLYPFLQKYFVAGVTVGAIKG